MNVALYFGRGEVLTTLPSGAPFFDGIEVGLRPDDIAFDLILQIGVEDGEPILNWIRVERRRATPTPANRWSSGSTSCCPS